MFVYVEQGSSLWVNSSRIKARVSEGHACLFRYLLLHSGLEKFTAGSELVRKKKKEIATRRELFEQTLCLGDTWFTHEHEAWRL